MDKIKNINSIFEAARSQVSNQMKPGKLKSGKSTANKKTQPVKKSKGNLKLSISHKLKSLDPQSDKYLDLASNIFFESVIINEFGDEIINSPEFSSLINKLSDAFKSNPTSSEKLETLLISLTKD